MQPPMPAITALYAALVALVLLVLAVRVSSLRMRLKVGLGDGGDPGLQRAVRAHANAVEWALPVLLLMLIAELNRAVPLLLHACGIVLIVARVLHGFGLTRPQLIRPLLGHRPHVERAGRARGVEPLGVPVAGHQVNRFSTASSPQ